MQQEVLFSLALTWSKLKAEHGEYRKIINCVEAMKMGNPVSFDCHNTRSVKVLRFVWGRLHKTFKVKCEV